MRYHLTFDASGPPGPEFLLTGLEYDPATGKLGLEPLPGDPIRFAPLYPIAAEPPQVAGLAADASGRLYVADPAGSWLWRVTLDPLGAPESIEAFPSAPHGSHAVALGPSAVLVATLGLIWVAEPNANRVRLFDEANGAPRGEARASLRHPEFLAMDSRGRVYVSDSRGVARFTADGRPDPMRTPVAAAAGNGTGAIAVLPDRRNVDGDSAGETLVLADGASLCRFSLEGDPVPWSSGDFILPLLPDRDPGALDLFDVLLNVPSFAPTTRVKPREFGPSEGPIRAMTAWDGKLWLGLAAEVDTTKDARLYALDPSTLRLARVTSADLGEVRVGGLAVAGSDDRSACQALMGRLLVHDPSRGAVIALRAGAARHVQGALLAGPFDDTSGLGRWYRLGCPGECPPNARFRFLTLTSDPSDAKPLTTLAELAARFPPPAPLWYLTQVPPADSKNEQRFQASGDDQADAVVAIADAANAPRWTPPNTWRNAADQALETRVWHEPASPPKPARRLWIAAFFYGDGSATAALGALTVEAGHQGWERDLPSIYQRDSLTSALEQGDTTVPLPPPTLLDGLLGLFEAAAGVDEARINEIPNWFDPRITKDLQGLASHLGMDPEGVTLERLRQAVSAFYEVASLRGTTDGLARAVKLETGIRAKLIEPIQTASLWVLGKTGGLGALTRLSPGPTQGALLDETATLDHARLIPNPDAGSALWDDLVGRVVAHVYASEVPDLPTRRTLDRCVRDRAPAHAEVIVRVIEPQARVGYQATLGLDAVLARADGGGRPLALGDPLGPDHHLGTPTPARPPGAAWLGHDVMT